MNESKPWQSELDFVKLIVEKTELTHHIKWGIDVYAYNKWNIIGIAPFKNFLGIWFYDGVFMKDPENKFISGPEVKPKALRQCRFTSLEELKKFNLKAYINESIINAKAGKHWVPEKTTKVEIPDLLNQAFETNSKLKASFDKFSPSKQKEFALHLTSAKRPQTQLERFEKIKLLILEGKGLHDKYKK